MSGQAQCEAQKIVALSAWELATHIREGNLRAETVVEATLARIESCNPAINALCTVDSGRSLIAARNIDRQRSRGDNLPALAGVPVGIKDITATAELRTTFGSPLCQNNVPQYDAEVVARLRAAGAIVIGKTNTPEFAAGANTVNPLFGATCNPWDTRLSAGGSTGGGAAALASGMIALAQGTDLGGSLRNPAAFCGVVGLRPTPGLVPTVPSSAPWDTLQVDGPMARTAADVWLALQSMAGYCRHTGVSIPGRPAASELPLNLQPLDKQPRPYKVAYIEDIAGFGMDPSISQQCAGALERLKAKGCAVERIELNLRGYVGSFITLRGQVIVAQLYPWLERIDELGENLQNNLRSGLAVTTRELAAAQHQRHTLRQKLMTLLEGYDALLTPTTSVMPFPVKQNYPAQIAGHPMTSYIDWVAPTFLWSLPGLPVVSVPAGYTSIGLPVGLQIMTQPWQEGLALATAGMIEPGTPFILAPGTHGPGLAGTADEAGL